MRMEHGKSCEKWWKTVSCCKSIKRMGLTRELRARLMQCWQCWSEFRLTGRRLQCSSGLRTICRPAVPYSFPHGFSAEAGECPQDKCCSSLDDDWFSLFLNVERGWIGKTRQIYEKMCALPPATTRCLPRSGECDFSFHKMFMQISGESKPLRMAFLFGALNEVAANEIKSLFKGEKLIVHEVYGLIEIDLFIYQQDQHDW